MAKKLRGQGQVTLTDLTDSLTIITYISSDNQRQILHNPNNDTYIPDFKESPMTLTPEVYVTGQGDSDQAHLITNPVWSYQHKSQTDYVKIEKSDDIHELKGGSLIIKDNVLTDAFSRTYRIDFEFPNGGELTHVTADIELVKVELGRDGEDGDAGEDAVVGHLTNDSHTIYTDSEGKNGVYTGASTEFIVYKGAREVTDEWEVTIEEGLGLEGDFDKENHIYTLTEITVNSSRVIFKASKEGYEDIIKVFTVNRLKSAKDGQSAVTFMLESDTFYLRKDREEDKITPGEFDIRGTKSVGTDKPNIVPGYFVIYEQLEDTITIDNYTDLVYKSLVDIEKEYVLSNEDFPYVKAYQSMEAEESITYKPSKNIYKVHIEWYEDEDLTVLRDVEQIPVVADGMDAYRVEIHSLNGDTFKNGVIDTWLYAIVYKGDTDVTAEIEEGIFQWTRTSMDSIGDEEWNNRYYGGAKEVKITSDDVYKRATFTCSIRKQ